MMEYIEKQLLLKKSKKIMNSAFAAPLIIAEIEKAQAADVEKVIYAKWEICCDGYYPYCSHCKTEPKNGVMSKRCPECGAKMVMCKSN